MLTEAQYQFIHAEIEQSSIRLQSLKDDLFDHFCCFVEEEMQKGVYFEAAYARAKQEIAPNGLMEIQQETLFLLNAKKIKAMKTLTYVVGLFSAMSCCTGFIFKIMHFPGANILFNGGFLLFVLGFVPLLAMEKYKLQIGKLLSERLKIALGATSAIITGLGVFFKIMHLPGGNILFGLGAFLFIMGFLPFLFFTLYRKSIQQ